MGSSKKVQVRFFWGLIISSLDSRKRVWNLGSRPPVKSVVQVIATLRSGLTRVLRAAMSIVLITVSGALMELLLHASCARRGSALCMGGTRLATNLRMADVGLVIFVHHEPPCMLTLACSGCVISWTVAAGHYSLSLHCCRWQCPQPARNDGGLLASFRVTSTIVRSVPCTSSSRLQ